MQQKLTSQVPIRKPGIRTQTRTAAFVALAGLCLSAFAFTQTSALPPPEKQTVLWTKLESSILDVDRDLDGVMGVAILDLTDGHKYLLHADDVFPQASSIKICVLAELYRQVQQGKLKLTDSIPGNHPLAVGVCGSYSRESANRVVNAADLVPDSDIMGGLKPGVTRLTLRDLATMMVAVSDNSATNVLIDRVGMDSVNAFLSAQGLRDTHLRRKMMDLKAAAEGRENVSSPNEMMSLLEALYRGKVLNKEMTEDFFKVLSTHKDSFIPRKLPDDLKIANKPGELEGVRNDSGVIFVEKRPYILCVMTTYLRRERDGEEAISDVSLAAWRMFDRIARASEYGRVISPGNSSR